MSYIDNLKNLITSQPSGFISEKSVEFHTSSMLEIHRDLEAELLRVIDNHYKRTKGAGLMAAQGTSVLANCMSQTTDALLLSLVEGYALGLSFLASQGKKESLNDFRKETEGRYNAKN